MQKHNSNENNFAVLRWVSVYPEASFYSMTKRDER